MSSSEYDEEEDCLDFCERGAYTELMNDFEVSFFADFILYLFVLSMFFFTILHVKYLLKAFQCLSFLSL